MFKDFQALNSPSVTFAEASHKIRAKKNKLFISGCVSASHRNLLKSAQRNFLLISRLSGSFPLCYHIQNPHHYVRLFLHLKWKITKHGCVLWTLNVGKFEEESMTFMILFNGDAMKKSKSHFSHFICMWVSKQAVQSSWTSHPKKL